MENRGRFRHHRGRCRRQTNIFRAGSKYKNQPQINSFSRCCTVHTLTQTKHAIHNIADEKYNILNDRKLAHAIVSYLSLAHFSSSRSCLRTHIEVETLWYITFRSRALPNTPIDQSNAFIFGHIFLTAQ